MIRRYSISTYSIKIFMTFSVSNGQNQLVAGICIYPQL